MIDLITIELKNLRFFAHHGLYAEEKKIGNEFEVNLWVIYTSGSGVINDIAQTINYATLYELLKTEMQKPRDLLETVVMEITERIYLFYPNVKKVEIVVTKMHPPITTFIGTIGVRYSKEW